MLRTSFTCSLKAKKKVFLPKLWNMASARRLSVSDSYCYDHSTLNVSHSKRGFTLLLPDFIVVEFSFDDVQSTALNSHMSSCPLISPLMNCDHHIWWPFLAAGIRRTSFNGSSDRPLPLFADGWWFSQIRTWMCFAPGHFGHFACCDHRRVSRCNQLRHLMYITI